MFKKAGASLVSKYLRKYLGKYIQGLDKENLDVSKGNIELHHLTVRKDVLDDLELPVVVLYGCLENLKISIPWLDLSSKPTEVEISGLCLLVGPKNETGLSNQEIMKRIWESKEKLLALADLRSAPTSEEKDEGFFAKKLSSFISQIVANVKVTVKNIHIRYYNPSFNALPTSFDCGLTLDYLVLRTIDKQKVPIVAKESDETVFKLLSLFNLALYWNVTSCESPPLQSDKNLFRTMIAMIYREENKKTGLEYILKPACGELICQYIKKQGVSAGMAKIRVQSMLPDISLVVHKAQYSALQKLLGFFHNYSKKLRYLRYHPHEAITANPLRWWKYLFLATREKTKQRKSWKNTLHFISHRKEYVRIWYAIKMKASLKDADRLRLKQLEKYYDIEEILLFRDMAMDRVSARKTKEKEKKSTSLFSFGKKKDKSSPKISGELTDDNIQGISYQLEVSVSGISAILCDTPGSPMLETFFSSLSFKSNFHTSGALELYSSLGKMTVKECCTPHSEFPFIIQPIKQSSQAIGTSSLLISPDRMEYDLQARLSPMEVILAPKLIERMRSFFTSELQEETRKDMELLLFLKVQEIKSLAKKRVRQTLKEKRIIIRSDIVIQSPRVIISESLTEPSSPLFFFSLGNLTIMNVKAQEGGGNIPLELSENQDFSSLPKQHFHHFYHRYDVAITNIFGSLTTARAYRSKNKRELPITIVESFTSSATVSLCSINDPHLPMIRLLLKAPPVKVHLSTKTLISLALISDAYTQGSIAQSKENGNQLSDTFTQYKRAERAFTRSEMTLPESAEFEVEIHAGGLEVSLKDETAAYPTSFLFLIREMDSRMDSTSYKHRGSFSLQFASLHAIVEDVRLPLFSTEMGHSLSITSQLEQKVVLPKGDFCSIHWTSLSSTSPLSSSVIHDISMKFRQPIISLNLIAFDAWYTLLFKITSGYKERCKTLVPIKPALTLDSTQIIQSLVYPKEQVDFVHIHMSFDSIIALVPFHSRKLEFGLYAGTLDFRCSSTFDSCFLSGQTKSIDMNIPLHPSEPYFPHFAVIKRAGDKLCTFELSASIHPPPPNLPDQGKEFSLSFTLADAIIEIPTSRIQESATLLSVEEIGVRVGWKEGAENQIHLHATKCSVHYREPGVYVDYVLVEPTNIKVDAVKGNHGTGPDQEIMNMKIYVTGTHCHFKEYYILKLYSFITTLLKLQSDIERAVVGGKAVIKNIKNLYDIKKVPSNRETHRISFHIENITIDYENESPLCGVIVHDVSLKVKKFKDHRIEFLSDVQELSIHDSRVASLHHPCRELISRRFLKDKIMMSSTPQFSLHLSYARDGQNKLSVCIDQTYFIIVMDFWRDLVPAMLPLYTGLRSHVLPSSVSLPSQDPLPVVVEEVMTWDIRCSITNPEICIIEDPTSFQSDCIVIKSSLLSLKCVYTHTIVHPDLRLEGIMLGKRVISDEMIVPLIEPFSIIMEQREEGDIQKTMCRINPIDATFSVRDYQLFLAIYESWLPSLHSLMTHFTKQEAGNTSSLPLATQTKQLVEGTIQEAKNKIQTLAEKVEKNTKAAEPVNKAQHITVVVHAISLVLINDSVFKSRYNPIFMFQQYSTVMYIHIHKEFELNITNMALCADYFNSAIEVWEPMLEPWVVGFQIQKKGISTNFTIESQSLDFNVTPQLLSTLQSTVELLRTATEQKSQLDSYLKGDASPYILSNQTGFPLLYATLFDDSFIILKHNDERTLRLEDTLNRLHSDSSRSHDHQIIHIKLCDPSGYYSYHDQIFFHRIGQKPIRVIAHGHNDQNIATVDIGFRKGCKVITIRSNILVKNHCDVPIDLMEYYPDSICPPTHGSTLHPICPNETISLPVWFIKDGEFCVAPKDHQFGPPISLKARGILGSHRCEATDRKNVSDYFVWIYVEEQTQDCIFHLLPPIRVKNALPCQVECMFRYSNTKEKCDHHIITPDKSIPVHLADRSLPLEYQSRLDHFGTSIHYVAVEKSGEKNPKMTNKHEKIKTKTFIFLDKKHREFLLRVENQILKDGSLSITFYCDFVIVNRVGLPLLFSVPGSDDIEPGQDEMSGRIMTNQDPKLWYTRRSLPPPFLYSNDSKRIPLSLQIGNSDWSKPMELSTPGMITRLSVKGHLKNDPCYELSVTIKHAKHLFWRTKLVTIVPRFLLINESKETLSYRQFSNQHSFPLASGDQIPFHWIDQSLDHHLSILYGSSDDYRWSSPFSIEEFGMYFIKVRTSHSVHQWRILCIHISLDKDSDVTLIHINENTSDQGFMIDNQLPLDICMAQKGSPISETISSYSQIPFAWDSLLQERVVQLFLYGKSYSFSFHRFSSEDIVIHAPGSTYSVLVKVLAEGPMRVLQFSCKGTKKFSDFNISSSVFIDDEEFVEIGEDKNILHASVNIIISSLGVSIMNAVPTEILYVQVEFIELELTIGETRHSLLFNVGNVQMNNQMLRASFPILLYCIPPTISGTNMEQTPNFLQILATKNIEVSSVDYFEYFSLTIGCMDIKIGEEIVEALADIAPFVSDLLASISYSRVDKKKEEVDYFYFKASTAVMSLTRMYYFDDLIINPIRFLISTHSGTGSAQYSKLLPMRGKLLGNVDNASIVLKGLHLRAPFNSQDELISRIGGHYKQSLVREIYKIIGSADILGNPISLINNMGTGVYDFFNEPAKAIVKNPADFGLGLKRGTSSLVKKTVYSVASSASRFSGNIAQIGSYFTFDETFQKNWANTSSAREQPLGAIDGCKKAVVATGSGVVQAFVDIIQTPIQGARTGGISGAVLGTVLGASGVIVKPLVLGFGSASIITKGFGNTVMNWEEKRERSRLPRYIGANGILQVFHPDDAAGHLLLQCLGDGHYAKEWYQNSFALEDGILIITNIRLLIVKGSKIALDSHYRNLRGLQFFEHQIILLHKRAPLPTSYWQYTPSPLFYRLVPKNMEKTASIFEQLSQSITSYNKQKC